MPIHTSKAKGSRATGTAMSAKRKTPVRGKSAAAKGSRATGTAKSAIGRARTTRKR